MRRKKRIITNKLSLKKRLKWRIKNNYVFLIIVGVVCLIATSILIYEVSRFERMRNMEVILQKTRRSMHWKGGITDQDIEVLKKRYPNVNWENQHDRRRWMGTQKDHKELRSIEGAKRRLRPKPKE